MLTAGIVRQVYDTVRSHLPGAQVAVRLHGKSITAVRPGLDAQAKASMTGMDPGYQGPILFRVSELPARGCNDGDTLEINEGGQWITYRVRGNTNTAGAMLRAEMESEYTE